MTTETTPMDVQNAAALSMLATRCCCCRLALRDPISVELGIGPICRKTLWEATAKTISPAALKRAKELVYELALDASADKIDAGKVLVASDALQEMGFMGLAATLVKRNAKISVQTMGDGRILVKVPYDNSASRALYRLGGNPHRDTRNKFVGYIFPVATKNRVWGTMRQYFVGALGVGPEGRPFVVTKIGA